MVATAVAMATDLDMRFQTALANNLPAFLTNPTARSRAPAPWRIAWPTCAGGRASRAVDGRARAGLPVLGKAPEFAGNDRWFNTPAARRSLGGCAGRSCWSTSGPTPASTASARCRT